MSEADRASVLPLWPLAAPGSDTQPDLEQESSTPPPRSIRIVRNVTQPSLTAFLPAPALATGSAVIVCPGGAYHMLAIEHEGADVARWLTAPPCSGRPTPMACARSRTATPTATRSGSGALPWRQRLASAMDPNEGLHRYSMDAAPRRQRDQDRPAITRPCCPAGNTPCALIPWRGMFAHKRS